MKKRDKDLDLARELKELWNMKLTVRLPVICVLNADTKGLENLLGLRGEVDTIQTSALRSARILRRVLEIRGDLLS